MSGTAPAAIHRVLVALDGSERARRALSAATVFAHQAHASLELVTVQVAGGEWERQLEPLAEALPVSDVDTTLVTTGPPDEAIVDLAERVPGTVVCMATRARSGLSEVLLGSTAVRVVRRTLRPVMLVGPEASPADPPSRYSHLAACLSGSARAEQMLPLVDCWARQLCIPTAFVHGIAQDTVASEHVPRKERLHELAGRAADTGTTVQITAGPTPAAGVRAYLDQHPDCLALVSLRRGARVERLLPGGFTAELLQHVPTPVVVLPATSSP